MIYLMAFLFAGFMCMLAQIIFDNTSLTSGHITALFTVLGAILSFLGIYDKLISLCGSGASILITNFGHLLFQSGVEGYNQNGFFGIFTNLLSKSSLAIVSAIVLAFTLTIFFKPKD